jgi:hypothetical protein
MEASGFIAVDANGVKRWVVVKIVWTVCDTWKRRNVANFLEEPDAIAFARGENLANPVPRFDVSRSLSVNGKEAV